MVATISIAAITCVALIVTVIVKPEIKIKSVTIPLYPFVALLGAALILIFSPLNINDCVEGVVGAGAVNPVKILVLFISVTGISVFLDEAGLFEFLAQRILSRSGGKQTRLFFLLYAAVSLLTVFTSNDIIILTFTPFIIYFCKNAKIKAFPYLMAEFVAANTWSMALIIGNPTNIYLATSVGINFFAYIKTMILPTVLSGAASALVLYLLFMKALKQPFEGTVETQPLKDRPMCILGGVVLLACTVCLAVSSFIGFEMWLVAVASFGALILTAIVVKLCMKQKPTIVGRMLLRLPYALVPFVLSMFIISLALDKTGVTAIVAKWLSGSETLLYGVASFFVSNLMNNIPMSIVFSSMITSAGAGGGAAYASIIGSNLGAILTPIGALAGIMFSSICKKHDEKISPFKFIGYGSVVSLVSLSVAIASLLLVL